MKETFEISSGSLFSYKEDRFHRDCGPANVWKNGSVYFFKENWLHRDYGPHVIHLDGKKGFEYSTPESVIPLLLLEWEKKYERDF